VNARIREERLLTSAHGFGPAALPAPGGGSRTGRTVKPASLIFCKEKN
jgi:hypothetical protein